MALVSWYSSTSTWSNRDLTLAELTGARLHVAHVSTAAGVDAIRRARDRGVQVTAEVTPHHLSLTDEAVLGFDTNTKMSPPLRGEADVRACRQGLVDGVLDAIATDHAPHAVHEKDVEFTEAPAGVIGFETAAAVALDLVQSDEIAPLELMRRLSTNPARILRRPGGSLASGAPADVALIVLAAVAIEVVVRRWYPTPQPGLVSTEEGQPVER